MREVSFERPGTLNATRSLQQVERFFAANGYTVSARTDGELHLVSTAAHPHRLSVSANSARMVFVFTAATLTGSVPEANELERAVDASLGNASAAVIAPRAASGGGRCSICATVIPAGATECPTCGMTT
jgi:hypothetical protein